MISVLIVDDNEIFRFSLKKRLMNYRIVGEAKSLDEAFRLVSVYEPDLVLLGLKKAEVSMLTIIEVMKKLSSITKVLILTTLQKKDCLALSDLADGIVSKHCGPEVLKKAIRRVAEGNKFVFTN